MEEGKAGRGEKEVICHISFGISHLVFWILTRLHRSKVERNKMINEKCKKIYDKWLPLSRRVNAGLAEAPLLPDVKALPQVLSQLPHAREAKSPNSCTTAQALFDSLHSQVRA